MRRVLDRLTGGVTMYRLVIAILVVITAAAFAYAIFGDLGRDPVAMLVNLLVAVGVSMLTSWGIAPLFKLKPHLESSMITGLLVFFITFPSLDAQLIATTALVAGLASASKYLIAVRGRHVLNPAAAGLTLAAAFGLATQAWWVATPVLMPFVLIGALLVLYRTRKLIVGLAFMVLAIALTFAAYYSLSGSVEFAATTALLSSPAVFLGGFMLSEPLTLPPRRRQQIAVAVIVAVLFALPPWLSVLDVPVNEWVARILGPAFALVVGNIVAFFFGQKRALRLTLTSRRQLTPTTWEFGFTPNAPVAFLPGQYMELTLPHRPGDARGSRRTFSIASVSPGGNITFGIKFSQKTSTFKSALAALPLGTSLRATSVGGDFLLPEDTETPILLIAGGIGITPFISQLSEAAARDAVLVYSVSSLDEMAYAEELEKSGIRVLLKAPMAPAELPSTWHYLGADRLSAEQLQHEVPELSSRTVYVSGPPAMVSDLKAALHSTGVRKVVSDYFTGY